MSEPTKFYVVRGYDKDGKQVGDSCKFVFADSAAMQAKDLFREGCKSVDIDLIECES